MTGSGRIMDRLLCEMFLFPPYFCYQFMYSNHQANHINLPKKRRDDSA